MPIMAAWIWHHQGELLTFISKLFPKRVAEYNWFLPIRNDRVTALKPIFKSAGNFHDVIVAFFQKHLHRTGGCRIAWSVALGIDDHLRTKRNLGIPVFEFCERN